MTTLKSRLEQAMGDRVKRADLARACNVSRAAVTKWFSGDQVDLKMENLFAVAKKCDVEPEWLALGKGPMRRGSRGDERPTAAPQFERRHVALLQAYLSLPREVRLPIRALIETLAASNNPSMRRFMRALEAEVESRDAGESAAFGVKGSPGTKRG